MMKIQAFIIWSLFTILWADNYVSAQVSVSGTENISYRNTMLPVWGVSLFNLKNEINSYNVKNYMHYFVDHCAYIQSIYKKNRYSIICRFQKCLRAPPVVLAIPFVVN